MPVSIKFIFPALQGETAPRVSDENTGHQLPDVLEIPSDTISKIDYWANLYVNHMDPRTVRSVATKLNLITPNKYVKVHQSIEGYQSMKHLAKLLTQYGLAGYMTINSW